MDEAAIWRSHLNPDEHIVWSGAESRAMLAAVHRSRRTMWIWMGLAAGVLALAAGFGFQVAMFGHAGQHNLAGNVSAPIYLVFALALGVAAIFLFIRVFSPPPAPIHYAATSLRLIAMDTTGRLTQQMPGADIADVQLIERTNTSSLVVAARPQSEGASAFWLHNIDQAVTLKALIEQTFPESHQ